MFLKTTFGGNFIVLLLMAGIATALVISNPHPNASSTQSRSESPPSSRQAKTLDMTMGMNMVKDMLQNGIPYRPLPSPFFSNIKNLFRTNGTYVRWVPLGSLIFGNNGKIIGG